MANYTAADVKALREKSGAGMMDAKKALEETNGDMEAAVDLLRAKGLATAAKKSSRTAAEGLVGVAVDGTKGTAVEINSQTDFVAKNEQFQAFVRDVTQVALAEGITDIETRSTAVTKRAGVNSFFGPGKSLLRSRASRMGIVMRSLPGQCGVRAARGSRQPDGPYRA